MNRTASVVMVFVILDAHGLDAQVDTQTEQIAIGSYDKTIVNEYLAENLPMYEAVRKLGGAAGIPIFIEDVTIEGQNKQLHMVGELESIRVNISAKGKSLKEILYQIDESRNIFIARAGDKCINIISNRLVFLGDPMSNIMNEAVFEGNQDDMIQFLSWPYGVHLEHVSMLPFSRRSPVKVEIKGDWSLRKFINEICIRSNVFWAAKFRSDRIDDKFLVHDSNGIVVDAQDHASFGDMIFIFDPW